MRKTLLALMLISVFSVSAVFAQVLEDYVLETKGDTLVIKDFYDMGDVANSLTEIFGLDESAPEGRVYELKANGYYPLSSNPTLPARPVVIAGAMNEPIVAASGDDALPIICGYAANSGSIGFSDDLTVKNCAVYQISADGTLGWAFFGAGANSEGKTLTLENCLMEHTRWVMIQSNNSAGVNFHINDCYFVNMTGQPCRRNGGVFDNVNYNTGEMVVENSTHVMAQGMIYKFRNYQVPNAFFNHNTFVNMGSSVFETAGYLSNWVVTNNIFVNCNVQPYAKGLDYSETDPDSLPTGIINVTPLPEGFTQYDRKVYVDNNVVAWSPELSDVASQASAANVNGTSEWYDQMITMNTRTQEMFDNDATYPYLTEGTWYTQMPTFTDSQDLFTDQLANFEEFCVLTVADDATAVLPVWRLIYTDAADYIYSDWPIPVDLSYSDEALLTGATGGFPVGDLNWFPAEKAAWEAQKAIEHATIEAVKETGDVNAPGNMVANGGFEADAVGSETAEGWGFYVGGGEATFAIVDDPVEEGNRALAITINTLGMNDWDIQIAAENVPAIPGQLYKFSAWAKTSDAEGSTVNFTVGNASYSEYGRIFDAALTTEWTEYTFEFTVNDNRTVIRVPIHVNRPTNAGDIIYIDNVSISPVVAVDPVVEGLPTQYKLAQNYPNPFNPTTTINFSVPNAGDVTLKVYDAMGREVATLVDGFMSASQSHNVVFDGAGLASGMYIYTIKAEGYQASKKMLLMK